MGHWYTSSGEPMHFINGRDTTLRDARKLNLFPSVTTIIELLDKPALVNWKLKQVTKACHMGADLYSGLDWEEYHKRALNDAFKESTGQRDRGSEIHNAAEAWFKDDEDTPFDNNVWDIATGAGLAILEYCGVPWPVPIGDSSLVPEQAVVGDGYGGTVDLHSDDLVIDWKTKDIKDGQTGKQLAWPEMAMQLAAYNWALGMGPRRDYSRRCINVFIDRTKPGKVVIHEWTPEEIEKAWEQFQLLVKFWQLSKNYQPEAA